jgi:hypothetical protein
LSHSVCGFNFNTNFDICVSSQAFHSEKLGHNFLPVGLLIAWNIWLTHLLYLQQRALIEQQELRRVQKEQQERERLRLENEKRREREEEEALEKAR